MSLGAVVLFLAMLVGLLLIFVVGEIRAYHIHGRKNPSCTYSWVRTLYEKFRLDRYRW